MRSRARRSRSYGERNEIYDERVTRPLDGATRCRVAPHSRPKHILFDNSVQIVFAKRPVAVASRWRRVAVIARTRAPGIERFGLLRPEIFFARNERITGALRRGY